MNYWFGRAGLADTEQELLYLIDNPLITMHLFGLESYSAGVAFTLGGRVAGQGEAAPVSELFILLRE